MARLFDDAQTEYLQLDEAILTAAPLAMVLLLLGTPET